MGCENLKSVTIPKNVSYIGAGAFGYGHVAEYKYPQSNTKYSYFIIYGYRNTEAERYALENSFEFISLDDVKFGDITGNGNIGVSDLMILAKYISGKIDFNDEQKLAADLNGDGKINSEDILILIKYLVGEITEFPL